MSATDSGRTSSARPATPVPAADWVGQVARDRIETERLVLERVGLARVRAIVSGNLAMVRAGAGWPHQETLDGLRMAAAHAQTDEDTDWLILLRTTGEVIGECGWKGGPGADGSAEIGYGLARPFRGQGYGTEAVAALAGWALAQPGCRQLLAHVLPGNVASRRLLERVGFIETGRAGEDLVYATLR